MFPTISISIICITVLILGIKLLSILSLIFKTKYHTEFKKVKYHEDTKLKIEEPVRPVPINDKVIQEIESIKTQLTGLNLNQGIKRR